MSSSEDAKDIITELSFYNDDILWNIDLKLRHFYPNTQYHIQPDECERRVIEVEGYKVTSNFVPLFKALLDKHGDFGSDCVRTKNVKSVLFYFFCRIVSDMLRTYIDNISEEQLFTWLYYMKHLRWCRFRLKFVEPFLDRVKRSYFGLRVMKFEDEPPDRLERNIVNLETQIKKLKYHRQQRRPGKIAEESKVLKEFIIEAKQLKHERAGVGIV